MLSDPQAPIEPPQLTLAARYRMTTSLLLGKEELRSLVLAVGLDRLMDLTIDRIEQLLHETRGETLEIPPRQGFLTSAGDACAMEWMPILRRDHHTLVKHVGYHPSNPAVRALPTIVSVLTMFDEQSGHLRTVCDGTFLTAVRTGAASAVASRRLAIPESVTLGMIGCGAQAVSQVHALSRVFALERVVHYDPDAGAQASFPDRAARFGVPLRAADPDEIARTSDILCTVTSVAPRRGPVIALDHCTDWLHVNAVGSDLPGKTELPAAFLRGALVVPDFTEQAEREGESQQLPPEQIGPELHDVVRHPGRYLAWQRRHTVFDSTGYALEDLAALEIVERLAREHGIGREIEIEATGADPRDPYGFLGDAAASAAVARVLAASLDDRSPARHGT